jgi:glucosamine-6-phosphate deaminase
MSITVFVTRDFEHLSEVGADVVIKKTASVLRQKKEAVLGLATGNSPTGLYKHFARAANEGRWIRPIRSFNWTNTSACRDNVQQRVLHRKATLTS